MVEFDNSSDAGLSFTYLVAAVVLAFSGYVVWPAAMVLMVSSTAGGYLGGRWARRLPEVVLRGMVVAVGVVATTVLVLG